MAQQIENNPLVRRHLRDAVQHQILPRLATENQWRIILAEPPFHQPPEVTVQYHRGKPLTPHEATRNHPSAGVMRYWPSAEVHSSRFPFMGFTLEGETDWRVGITSADARQFKKEFARSDYALLGLPPGSFFLMPPGTPFSSHALHHWERAPLSEANSRRFMMRFHDLGMRCHFSCTTPEGLQAVAHCYFLDSQLDPILQALIDELRLGPRANSQAVQGLLVFIMRRALRGLENLQAGGLVTSGDFSAVHGDHDISQVVDKACSYIEAHFHQKLTVDIVAEQVGVSPTHLFRLFHSIKGMTVMEYLTRFRLNYACTLLRDGQMNISEIGYSVGYSNHAHFCRVFSRYYQCTPSEFRKKSWD